MRAFPPVLCLMNLLVAAGLTGCDRGPTDSPPATTAEPNGSVEPIEVTETIDTIEPWFSETASDTGLDFVHFNGMTGQFYQPEVMAPGVGLFDYDNDGDLDVYLVQGQTLGEPSGAAPDGRELGDRLYRNDLRNDLNPNDSTGGSLRFTDVTTESEIVTRGYGMGVATGDIDNDGDVDLYLTGVGRNQMFRNDGDGTFTDVSQASGTDDPVSWSVSAGFVDYDRDGWLDLFVGNYLQFDLANRIACVGVSGLADYCRPSAYRPQPNRLYRNQGDGRFVDGTIASGIARDFGPALGVSAADFNADGWPDLFVANDEQENQLWINLQDGTFENSALMAGAALGPAGERKADMGVDAADFDADGDEDLFVTELTGQGSTLYVNDGTGLFEEQSTRAGIRGPSLPYTGFGTGWLDFDNDGWLDLLAVNGYVHRQPATVATADDPFPFGQRNQLFRNIGGRFEDVTDLAGPVFDLVEASRGAAFGDIDNDGDTDVVIGNGAGPVRLLLNQIGDRHHWIGLRLIGSATDSASSAGVEPTPSRDMLGTRVEIVRDDGTALWRRVRTDGSYASANDPRVLVGLGSSADAPQIRVVWPDGQLEQWSGLPVDRYTTLTAGTGEPIP